MHWLVSAVTQLAGCPRGQELKELEANSLFMDLQFLSFATLVIGCNFSLTAIAYVYQIVHDQIPAASKLGQLVNTARREKKFFHSLQDCETPCKPLSLQTNLKMH